MPKLAPGWLVPLLFHYRK